MKKTYAKVFTATFLVLMLASGTNILYAQGSGTTTENGTSTDIAIAPAEDKIEPSDVSNLKAQPGDAEVTLTWDASTDNVSVTGYKIYRGTRAVKSEEESYDLPVVPVTGNVKTYTVKNLTNDKTYYFAATAVDAAGNESISFSNEASAKPQAGLHAAAIEDDGKAPQVKKVSSEDTITVLVEFSEPVKLPEEQPQSAFKIERTVDKTRLQAQRAEMDSRDGSGKTVMLTTSPQMNESEYLLTVGMEVSDYFNNPIISGASDAGMFKGSAKTKAANPPQEDQTGGTENKEAPVVTGATSEAGNRIAVNFSEKVILPVNAKSQFKITKKGTTKTLTVTNASLSVDGRTVYLTTGKQENAEYEIKVMGVKDEDGNEISATANTATVSVTPAPKEEGSLEDLISPEDVSKLIARIKDAEKNIVELRWQASKNSANDLVDQLLYQGEGKNASEFGAGMSLGAEAAAAEVQDLQRGKWYTFKVATKDGTGNESRGAIRSIFLPETGPGMVAAGLTALLMGWYSRKRKK